MKWTSDVVREILGVAKPSNELEFSDVSTDTRTCAPGALFVALVGEKFDAHTFLPAARDAGAIGAVVCIGTAPVPGLQLFAVSDTLQALGALARYRRRGISGPVVAITGSNGKTSTKEMIKALLATKWSVHATRSNRNNLVGVPLTILEAPPDTQALVVEAGASVLGEIARLRDIIEPTVGVITNVAAAHLDGFGGLSGVLREKLALLNDVPMAVVGTEPSDLAQGARAIARHTIVAGLDTTAEVAPDQLTIDENGHIRFRLWENEFRVPVPGRHQAANAVIAVAVADAVGVSRAEMGDGLREVEIPGGRCEVRDYGNLRIIDDTYNANPSSFVASLDLVRALRGDRNVVILVGSMLEMGAEAADAHRDVARAILDLRPYLIGAVGDFAAAFSEIDGGEDTLVVADSADTLGKEVRGRLQGHELVFLKASRGVELERAIPHLISESETQCSTTS